MISPITPPDELVGQWLQKAREAGLGADARVIAAQAAQWGWDQRGAANEAELQQRADQELDACCGWLAEQTCFHPNSALIKDLRAARRPKAQSKAESALNALEHILRHSQTDHGANTIRLALGRLKELEALPND